MPCPNNLIALKGSQARRSRCNQRRVGGVSPCIMNTTASRPTFPAREDHREGFLAKSIEEQTAKLPSDTFLWLALGSIAASLTLKVTGRDKDALFVGQWAPTFLLLGVYNK